LIHELRDCLASDDYSSFLMAVAFVKVGPLIRLQKDVEKWLSKGKTIEAIWGVNHRGTSQQAIAFALNYFTKTYVLFAGESFTFHPKMYLFVGSGKCRFFIGSHNLTVGGTETNWEGGVRIDLSLPADQEMANEMISVWKSLVPQSVKVTGVNFPDFISSDLLLDESKMASRRNGGNGFQCPKRALHPLSVCDRPRRNAKTNSTLRNSICVGRFHQNKPIENEFSFFFAPYARQKLVL
jgi:HKD family nuclease